MSIDIGIKPKDRKAIADGLSHLLADTYTLYLKTHNFHWNVEGPMFNTLHLMFETQYTELALAVDLVAERIRAESERELAELVNASGALGFVSKTDLSGDAIRKLLARTDSGG